MQEKVKTRLKTEENRRVTKIYEMDKHGHVVS